MYEPVAKRPIYIPAKNHREISSFVTSIARIGDRCACTTPTPCRQRRMYFGTNYCLETRGISTGLRRYAHARYAVEQVVVSVWYRIRVSCSRNTYTSAPLVGTRVSRVKGLFSLRFSLLPSVAQYRSRLAFDSRIRLFAKELRVRERGRGGERKNRVCVIIIDKFSDNGDDTVEPGAEDHQVLDVCFQPVLRGKITADDQLSPIYFASFSSFWNDELAWTRSFRLRCELSNRDHIDMLQRDR